MALTVILVRRFYPKYTREVKFPQNKYLPKIKNETCEILMILVSYGRSVKFLSLEVAGPHKRHFGLSIIL